MPTIQKGYWLKEDRVIYAYVAGVMTPEAIQAQQAHFMAMFNQSTFPVDVIVEMDASTKVEVSLKTLQESTGGGHPSVRWTLLIVQSALIQFLGNAISQFRGRQYRFRAFINREEALAFLKEMDASLNDLTLPPIE